MDDHTVKEASRRKNGWNDSSLAKDSSTNNERWEEWLEGRVGVDKSDIRRALEYIYIYIER